MKSQNSETFRLIVLFYVVIGGIVAGRAQHLSLPYYFEKVPNQYKPVYHTYQFTCTTKEEAVLVHKNALIFMGIDTTDMDEKMDRDAPVFGNFFLIGSKKIVIIDYIKKNNFGEYDCVFMESKNEEFELFKSDGFTYVNTKIKE
jgi:hypothetical protein